MSYTYQKILDPAEGERTDVIRRKGDNAIIPFDPDNIDYQDYLSWLAEGNEPEAAG
tara:strand:+ start:1198 stop:1365 length:168 start_codon:yes stop_codon:yes gene_type:complete